MQETMRLVLHKGETNIVDTARFLRRGSLLAIVTALACGIAAFLVTSSQDPTYRASSQLYATDSARGLTPFSYSPAKLDAVAYGFAAITDEVLSSAAMNLMELGFGSHSTRSIRNSVQIGTEETTSASFVEVIATADSAELASAVANSVATALVSWDADRARSELTRIMAVLEQQVGDLDAEVASLTNDQSNDQMAAIRQVRLDQIRQLSFVRALATQSLGTIEVFEYATPPTGPVGPRVMLNTALAAVLGMVVAYGVILMIDALRPAQTLVNVRARNQ